MTESQGAVVRSGREATIRRVLMTADAVGGVWQYTTGLASALQARGVEVLVAVMGPALAIDQREDAASRNLRVVEGSFRLEWMESPWQDVRQCGEGLLDLERAFAPDIIHLNGYCHAALRWSSPAIVVAHSCVRSWWRAVHGTQAPEGWNQYSHEVARGLAAAREVVAPTHAMLDALRDEYGALGKGRVIPNARPPANTGHFDPVSKQDIVFAAGRVWDEAKNIAALCDIASSIEWPVYVAGEQGSSVGAGCEPAEAIRWLGRLSAQAVARWYARAAIYALPARYEPFGLSVLEAASAACALVLGDIRSLRENWDGAALFVAPGDRDALTRAIARLIAEPETREVLGAEAMRRAAEFTERRMTDAYMDLYASALHGHAVVQSDGSSFHRTVLTAL
jgi:glycogen synthase